jgi:hypothetical protein
MVRRKLTSVITRPRPKRAITGQVYSRYSPPPLLRPAIRQRLPPSRAALMSPSDHQPPRMLAIRALLTVGTT